MTEDDIDVSDKGIIISYRRFVSDSAPGLIFIASIYLIYRQYINETIFNVSLDAPEKTALFIFLFLISTPLGLAINGVSYFILDKIVHDSVEIFFLKRFFLKCTAAPDEFLYKMCKREEFLDKDITKEWIRFSNCIVRTMDIYYHDKWKAHQHEVGAHVFLRNLAFISLSILVIDLFIMALTPLSHKFEWHIYLFLIFLIGLLLVFSAFLSFYYRLAILCDAYVLSFKSEDKVIQPIKECLNHCEMNPSLMERLKCCLKCLF